MTPGHRAIQVPFVGEWVLLYREVLPEKAAPYIQGQWIEVSTGEVVHFSTSKPQMLRALQELTC